MKRMRQMSAGRHGHFLWGVPGLAVGRPIPRVYAGYCAADRLAVFQCGASEHARCSGRGRGSAPPEQ